MLGKFCIRLPPRFNWLSTLPIGGLFRHGNESVASLNDGNYVIISGLRTVIIVFWGINIYTQMLGAEVLFSTFFGLSYPSSGNIHCESCTYYC
jgi:hypothetical protein